jgi:uncharacterized membrane protein (TIGR02234 family)
MSGSATSEPADSSAEQVDDAAARARREYVLALVLLAAGAGLLLLGYGRTWVAATTAQDGLPSLTVTLAGGDLQPVGGALPLVALAGVAGVVATRRVGRLVSGAVLLVAGVVGAVLPLRFGLTWSSTGGDGATVDRLVAERVGVVVSGVPATASSWWVVAALGGALVAVGGLLAVLHGSRWPTMGGRYERSSRPRAREAESAWDQLDHGVDPTVDPALGPTPEQSTRGAAPDSTPGPDDPMLGSGRPA